MKPGDGLLIASFSSLGEAYQIVQGLPATAEVLDLIPSAGTTEVLISAPESDLSVLVRSLSERFSPRAFPNLPEVVEMAWLGLLSPPLKKQWAMFESESLGDVFEAAIRMSKSGMEPFDLRLLRGATPKAYVIATGDSKFSGSVSDLKGRLTEIADPSPALRDFFELKPH